MRNFHLVCAVLALAGCAATSGTVPQRAVVESEAARQIAVDAVAAGDSVDHALEKAATEPLPGDAPKR
jgi:hypothetical protein